MKKVKILLAMLLTITMVVAAFSGCNKKDKETGGDDDSDEIKVFSTFLAVPGTEIPDDNRVMQKIAEKIGAWTKITYLTGQTAEERVGAIITSGEYPDFIDGSTGSPALLDAEALVAIDEYWDDYPNIKNYLSESEWNMVKDEDGHIYRMPQFGIIQGKDMATNHNDEAFWIQKEVLIWDDYPEIKTMDEYFDLISRYLEAHPQTADGQDTVGFSMSTEDWRYFGIENPPMFLMGYPNDGACIVDPETETAINYDLIPEAYDYYKKMNDVWVQGLVHPETYTMSYDQYISLITTGRVLGILDQRWNFQTAEEALVSRGEFAKTYVPLPITFSNDIKDNWHSGSALDVSNGLSITKSCKDLEGALQFVNDLLDPEIHTLRRWGEEGVDYEVDDDGVFYRTPEQRTNSENKDWVTANLCKYDYFPHYEGMLADDINASDPKDQPGEFYVSLSDIEKQLLDGYGYNSFLDFLSPAEPNEPWYPMWSYTNAWTNDTPEGVARAKITDLKHEWLPQAMMAPEGEFEAIWDEYQATYKAEVDNDAYIDALNDEIQRRAAVSRGE